MQGLMVLLCCLLWGYAVSVNTNQQQNLASLSPADKTHMADRKMVTDITSQVYIKRNTNKSKLFKENLSLKQFLCCKV